MGCISSSSNVTELKDLSYMKLKDNKFNSEKTKFVNETSESQRRKKINKVEFINYSQTSQPTENVIISTEQFTVEDKLMLDQILSQNYIFHKLPSSQRKQIIDKFVIFDSQFDGKKQVNRSQNKNLADDNQYLFKKGDIGTMFFVIKNGNVEVELDKLEQSGRPKKLLLSKGDSFGQLALLYKTARTASVKCLTKCTFLCLSSHLFRQVLQNIVERTIESNKILIERIKLFHYLGPKEKNKLANNVIVLRYEKDDVVFRQGQDSLAFFIIVSGGVKIEVKNKPALQLRPGDYFGQSCFQQNSKRSGTVHCTERTQLMAISKSAIQKVFGKQFQQFYYFSILKWALKRNPILNKIPSKLIQKLLKQSDIISFSHGHTISREGQKVQKLFIPIEGKINNYEVGDIVNCQYLIDIQANKKNSILNQVSLVKQTQGYVCIIDINRVISILQRQNIFLAEISSKQFQDLKKAISSKKQLQQALNRSIKNSKFQVLSSIRAQNLKIVQKIADGQFGPIYKVRHFIDNQFFALKTFNKHQVDSHKMRNFVKQQIQVMQIIKQHNFIVQYHRHYQIQQHFLILMELIDGKDFFDTISDIGELNKQQVQFYFASFVLALEFMHQNDIIYRDIKPQNAVLQPNGYLKIIDLGTARILSQKNGYRSFTIIGTPHYMAPQVIAGKGYSFQADIWSLGILLYELVCGQSPYGKKLQEPIQIYDEIIKNGQTFSYPKTVQNPTKKLIERLLIKEPTIREIENFNEIKQSQFYEGFQWDKFTLKTMKAPYKAQKKQKITYSSMDRKKNSQETLMNFFDRIKFQTKRQNQKISFPKWDQF